jgi:hypothetical protein
LYSPKETTTKPTITTRNSFLFIKLFFYFLLGFRSFVVYICKSLQLKLLIMKKTLFILILLATSLFGFTACQEMFDDNGNVNWGDFPTETGTGTCTDSCTGEENHHNHNYGGTETGTCSGTQTGNHQGHGGGHGHHGQN